MGRSSCIIASDETKLTNLTMLTNASISSHLLDNDLTTYGRLCNGDMQPLPVEISSFGYKAHHGVLIPLSRYTA